MSERREKKQALMPAKPRADEWVAQGRENPGATEQKMKRLTLDLPEGLPRAMKRRAVEEGVTMVEMLRTLLYMRWLFLFLFRCHGLCISVHALWTRAVCYAEKMQDHPLCV